MADNKTYFITGGGTGGHIYPAIAVADALLKEKNTKKIYYIGNPNNMEAIITKNKNYKFLPVLSSGMPRRICVQLFKWIWTMIVATYNCYNYIKKYQPDAIFATGGYVSAPVILAGLIAKVPFVLHDCDANPGLVTRKFAPYAKSVSVAFESAKSILNVKNCNVNGNPIRPEFGKITKQEAKKQLGLKENKYTICITGGSQGAKTINEATVGALKTLSTDYNLQVIFQTGKRNYNDVIWALRNTYPQYVYNANLIIRPYFEDMVTILKAADIAVSRAGSLSISELCASSVATIFIPYPYAAADHQRKNAQYMRQKGAGLYLEDSETNSKSLLKKVYELISDQEVLKKYQDKAYELAKFDGVEKIVAQVTLAANSLQNTSQNH